MSVTDRWGSPRFNENDRARCELARSLHLHGDFGRSTDAHAAATPDSATKVGTGGLTSFYNSAGLTDVIAGVQGWYGT